MREIFSRQKSHPFGFNNFGGNIGGPMRRGKAFYFGNYEGSRQRIGITGTGTVPSALLRSRVLATSPALTPLSSSCLWALSPGGGENENAG